MAQPATTVVTNNTNTNSNNDNTDDNKTNNLNKIPTKLQKASYVLVPANPALPMKELTIDLTDDGSDPNAELTVFLDCIKQHYAKKKRTSDGTSAQMDHIKEQMKDKLKGVDPSAINANLLKHATTLEMVGTIQLMPPIPNIGNKRQNIGSSLYITTQMYLDDNGQFKNYQRNMRAESIAQTCLVKRLSPIFGDVFLSKYYDDDNNFRRMDFKLNDCNSSSNWIKEAKRRNNFKQLKPLDCHFKKCDKKGRSRCGRCLKVWYCSKECQKNDWSKHKKKCKKSTS